MGLNTGVTYTALHGLGPAYGGWGFLHLGLHS
jgi:hypothetical protein